jgi:hypothetical protein
VTAGLYGPAFFAGRSPLVTQSAEAVVPHLMALLNPTSVLDIGCGQGEWLDAFPVDDKMGVDIAAPDGPMFIRHDLTQPLLIDRLFDLVLCVEVGEHLPENKSDTLVDTIARRTDNVVFGAAVLGQEGTGHINCQPHRYWHDKFEARGFETLDVIRPLIADNPRVSPWYRSNMFVYRRPS